LGVGHSESEQNGGYRGAFGQKVIFFRISET
jgi:hypothetical protein